MKATLTRRLERLEARHRPNLATGPLVPLSALSPTVAALLIAYSMEVSQMSLEELRLVEADLRTLA